VILDSSALVAIFLAEPEGERFSRIIDEAATLGIGAPTLVEAAIVLRTRLGKRAIDTLAQFLRTGDVAVIPFGEEHSAVAMAAFARYGKGRHPAGLNYGDCLAYATAKIAGVPLLAKGDDFARTDLELA
jgi:ribonuclease VapC